MFIKESLQRVRSSCSLVNYYSSSCVGGGENVCSSVEHTIITVQGRRNRDDGGQITVVLYVFQIFSL